MTRLEYERKMLWAQFWLGVWHVWSFLRIPESTDDPIFSWMIGQTGFLYMRPWDDD